MSKIVIVSNPERKRPQVRRERKNVFSDETTLFLLRLLRKDSALPHSLGNIPAAARDLQLELAVAIRQRLLPWFWSISFHLLLLILLTLYVYQVVRHEPLDVLSAGIVHIPLPNEGHVIGTVNNGEGNTPNTTNNNRTDATAETPSTAPNTVNRTSPGLVFGYARGGNGGAGGGGETDTAILAGLHWLVKVQQPDGTWKFSGSFPQASIARRDDPLAATAMALLAFQGIGVAPYPTQPHLTDFVRPVRRGWDWLLQQQNPDGCFFTERSGIESHRFYTHALCTIALCERLIITGEKTLREPAQRSIDYCFRHQNRSGGWRYLPDRFSEQSDVSVTGWIVLALKSGEAAGLTIPPEAYNNAMRFLDSMMLSSNQYMYRAEEPMPSITMTAQASLCRMLLGWQRDNPRLAAGMKHLLDAPPSFAEQKRNVYYWFFATQTLYHYGGEEWQTWNATMRTELLAQQEKLGTEAGSWNPNRPVRDAWSQYGRLYTTCLSLYVLEVPYRHLRIFP